MHVALQLFAFDEDPDWFGETMDRWAEAAAFADADVDCHAGVTPLDAVTASHVDSYTINAQAAIMETARSHPAFEVIETPPGKLSSRNVAHDYAAERGYDVIVTTDADAPPLRENTLAELLAPFDDPAVVAVNSNPISFGPVGFAINLGTLIEDWVRPHMHGQASAFRSSAWQAAGPFDDSIDQTNIHTVRAEEEIELYHKFARLGKVPLAKRALVFNDTRRVTCHIQRARFGEPRSAHCRRVGVSTFDPKQPR